MKIMKKTFRTLTTYIKKHPRLDFILLGVGLAVFLTVTLINAPRASIWFDEGFSAYLVQFSFWDIARFTATDVHPPLYYWALKIWTSLFGTTDLALRSLSILFGAVAATLAFFLSRKLFGRGVAALSFVFIALSPMLIRYSDEARMYTMATVIVLAATWLLLKATETNKKKYWIWYGVLVSLGMWTHYFTALAWLAHWAWRFTQTYKKGDSFKKAWKKFFTKEWTLTYALAIGLYLPWLPWMAFQLVVVQSAGFWIGPVSADTFTNYLTSYLAYLEHGQIQGWLALAFYILLITLIIAIPKVYGAIEKKKRPGFLLVACMAIVPPVLLFFASMPPLQSSFVDRYVVPAIVFLSIFLAIVLIYGAKKRWQVKLHILAGVIIVGFMIYGITNVYKYGNYNKNSNTHVLTRQAIEAAQASSEPGVPIVSNSPWIYYEAAPYSTDEHPVYFIDENTQYNYGSLDMLKYSDIGKITDIEQFEQDNPVIWYLGGTEDEAVAPFDESWEAIETVTTYDSITGKSIYKATKYKVSD